MKTTIHGLYKVFESRIRLGIMSALMVNQKLDFNEFKQLLELTDGNLASHLTALEKHQFIQVKKRFVGKKPNTSYSATDLGRQKFTEHLNTLEALIKKVSQK